MQSRNCELRIVNCEWRTGCGPEAGIPRAPTHNSQLTILRSSVSRFFDPELSLTKTDAKSKARPVERTDGPQIWWRFSRRQEGDEERHRARPPAGGARGRRRVGPGRRDRLAA